METTEVLKMSKIISAIFLVSLTLMVFAGCKDKVKPRKIDISKKEEVTTQTVPNSKKSLTIAVGSMITPKAGFAYYQQLLKYIEKKLDIHVKFLDKDSYAEINKLMKDGTVDVGFICGRPYVDAHDQFGIELLVAPQAYGETVYYSYIIVRSDSPIKDLAGLRGKSFAFADPMSNSGKLVPTYILARKGETPKTYFQKYIYTFAHDKSIKAVAQGIVDGAAVDSLIWEFENKMNPEITGKTKVILKSAPHGIPPVVVRPNLDADVKKKIREVFLNLHEDEEGRAILKGMMIEKFVVVNDSLYDSIRQMKSFIGEK